MYFPKYITLIKPIRWVKTEDKMLEQHDHCGVAQRAIVSWLYCTTINLIWPELCSKTQFFNKSSKPVWVKVRIVLFGQVSKSLRSYLLTRRLILMHWSSKLTWWFATIFLKQFIKELSFAAKFQSIKCTISYLAMILLL